MRWFRNFAVQVSRGRLFELALLIVLGGAAFAINAAGPTAFLEIEMSPSARTVEATRAINQLVQAQRSQAPRSTPRPPPPPPPAPITGARRFDPPAAPVLSSVDPAPALRVRGPPLRSLVVA